MTVGRNELFAISSANILPPAIHQDVLHGSPPECQANLDACEVIPVKQNRHLQIAIQRVRVLAIHPRPAHSKACSCKNIAQFFHRKGMLLNVEPFIVSARLVERICCGPKLFVEND